MSSRIYDLTQSFPFDKVILKNPISRNGSYYMNFAVHDMPIYLQVPKCVLKQAFFKSGKKTYCDLMFSNENTNFMSWLEQLETVSFNAIYENREKWFETEFDKHDIETLITSPYKMYKSGKFFIIRASVPTTLGKCDLKVYNEDEDEVEIENVAENDQSICIVEFKGIKSSLRNFQFQIEIKQMLILKPEIKFEKCIINKVKPSVSVPVNVTEHVAEPVLEKKQEVIEKIKLPGLPKVDNRPSVLTGGEDFSANSLENNLARLSSPPPPPPSSPILENKEEEIQKETSPREEKKIETSVFIKPPSPPPSVELEILETEAEEVDLDLAEIKEDPVCLKSRYEVHYKMYKEAKKKAKEAKLLALSNYLEAKRIKDTYMLKDDSDEESDEKLDNVFPEK